MRPSFARFYCISFSFETSQPTPRYSKANESYHKYECGIIKLLLESGLNIYAYLALRLVTKEGLENLLKIKDDLELRRSEKSGASEDIKGFAR